MANASSIRVDDSVKEESTAIAEGLGMTFNAAVNVLLRKFNEARGFPFEVRLPDEASNITAMSLNEVSSRCEKAVRDRDPSYTPEYVLMEDPDTGAMCKKFKDGRVEYVVF